jgi:anti-sigma regulatory factor (Ser/Thr protein kinase)
MNPRPGDVIRMHIRSSPWQLAVVRAAVEKMCAQLGMDERSIGEMMLGVDEALTNVIRHAYEGQADRPIEIELSPCGSEEECIDCLQVVIRDEGRSVPAEQIRSRDLEDIRPGGLGVHIMQTVMDHVDYTPRPDGGTVLTLRKNLNPNANGAASDEPAE